MKILKKSALIAMLLAVSYLQTSAQNSALRLNEPNYNKAKLFSDLPDKLNLRLTDVEALLNISVGKQVNAIIATGFPLVGVVVSKSTLKDAFVKTVVIKSTTRQGATFTFSRITKEDGSLFYTGRMMSKEAGDALEIIKEGTGYVIRKKGFYDLINE